MPDRKEQSNAIVELQIDVQNAFIEHMTPTWRSNARRYGLNKRQTDAHVARMVSQTIAEQ